MLYEDHVLHTLAESPLMLHIMTLAYAGLSAEEVRSSDSLEARRDRLFAIYTERMLQRRRSAKPYTPSQTRVYLTWLARQLSHHAQAEFFLETMQPTWLSSRGLRWLYDISVRLIGGSGLVLAALLSYALAALCSYSATIFRGVLAHG